MPYYVVGRRCYGTHEIAKKINDFLKIKKEVDTPKGKKTQLIPLFTVTRHDVNTVLEKYYNSQVKRFHYKYGICYEMDAIERLMFGKNNLDFFNNIYKVFCQAHNVDFDARVYHTLRELVNESPQSNNSNHSTFEDESQRAKENLERIRKEPIKYRNSTDDDEDQFQSRDFENDNDAYSNYLIKTKYQESINRNKKIYITEEKFLRLFKNKLL